ncbi:hypothetical protein ANTQUA_LOCUS4092 [Anthophora quadrimaculata]
MKKKVPVKKVSYAGKRIVREGLLSSSHPSALFSDSSSYGGQCLTEDAAQLPPKVSLKVNKTNDSPLIEKPFPNPIVAASKETFHLALNSTELGSQGQSTLESNCYQSLSGPQ